MIIKICFFHINEKKKIIINTKMSVSEMRRGMGGRLEESFAASKESGKAAFISFITAGYPTPEGES